MSVIGYINVAVEAFGSMLSFVLALCLLLANEQRDTLNRLVVCAFLLGGAAQLFDMTAWLVEGAPGPVVHTAMRTTVFLTYICDFAHMGVLVQYLATYVGAHDPRVSAPRISRFCWWTIAVMAGLLVLNLFVPVFYTFDELNVYRETLLWTLLSQIFLLLFPAYGFFIALRGRKLLDPFTATVLIAGPLVMVAVFLVQGIVGDVLLSYLAVTVCTVLLYLSVQRERERTFVAQQLALEQHRTDLLLRQIRPHFLYNVITTIYGLVDIDPKEAQKAVREFAAFLRANMDALAQSAPLPFAKELDHLRAYLTIESRRFGARIVVEEDIGPVDFAVPALTVQPLAENAVRHGMAKDGSPITVRIATRKQDDCFEIEVSDNGVGFDPTLAAPSDGRGHVGLASVRERLARLVDGTLQVVSEPDKGTTALVRIPKQRAHDTAYAEREKGLL